MIELKIPEVGEAVQEALLAQWLKKDGESVRKDEVLFVIETDKVTLEISAPADGVLKILVPEGQTVKVGSVVGQVEETAAPTGAEEIKKPPEQAGEVPSPEPPRAAPSERRAPEPSPPPRAEEAVAKRAEEPALSKPVISSRSAPWRRKKEWTLPPLRRRALEVELPRETFCSPLEQHAPAKPAEEARDGNTPPRIRFGRRSIPSRRRKYFPQAHVSDSAADCRQAPGSAPEYGNAHHV